MATARGGCRHLSRDEIVLSFWQVLAVAVRFDLPVSEAVKRIGLNHGAFKDRKRRYRVEWDEVCRLLQIDQESLRRRHQGRRPGSEVPEERARRIIAEGLRIMDEELLLESEVEERLVATCPAAVGAKPYDKARSRYPGIHAEEVARRGVPDLTTYECALGKSEKSNKNRTKAQPITLGRYFRMRRAAAIHVAGETSISAIEVLLRLPKGTLTQYPTRWKALWADLCQEARRAQGLPDGVLRRAHFMADNQVSWVRGGSLLPAGWGEDGLLTFRKDGRSASKKGRRPVDPETYKYGPLEGTGQELGAALGSNAQTHQARKVLKAKIRAKVVHGSIPAL